MIKFINCLHAKRAGANSKAVSKIHRAARCFDFVANLSAFVAIYFDFMANFSAFVVELFYSKAKAPALTANHFYFAALSSAFVAGSPAQTACASIFSLD
jgi:hypothetical protein